MCVPAGVGVRFPLFMVAEVPPVCSALLSTCLTAIALPHWGAVIRLKHKNLPDAGGTVIREAVLSR